MRRAAFVAACTGFSMAALAAGISWDSLLVDLPEDAAKGARVSLEATPPSGGLADLDRLLEVVPTYRFESAELGVTTDTRWYGTEPNESPGAPSLELRRWPGDTVLAVFVLQGASPSQVPPFSGGRFDTPGQGPEGTRSWTGSLETEWGPRRAIWWEKRVDPAEKRLGMLILPGDGGLGPDAAAVLERETIAVANRIAPRSPAWKTAPGIARGTPLELPVLPPPPRSWDERQDPWQTVEARGFTLGLPSGIVARRLDGGVDPPRPVPGGVLWLRGRLVDRDGIHVSVGDARRAGYVAELAQPPPAWLEGTAPPLGAPGARKVDAGDLDRLALTWTGASLARAEHWKDAEFPGDWLVFRLGFTDRGVEVGLPVLEGWRSQALFWIPVTWRAEGQAPAPPPLDPAERFGFRFDRGTPAERKRRPWTEGELSVPGLRLEMPAGWWPVASLRTRDGFPVALVDRSGTALGSLKRLVRGTEGFPDVSRDEWQHVGRPGIHRAAQAYRRGDGAAVFLAGEGNGFLLEPGSLKEDERAAWERAVESVVLNRPGRN